MDIIFYWSWYTGTKDDTINILHNLALIRRQALRTLQNVTDTALYEILIFIGVG